MEYIHFEAQLCNKISIFKETSDFYKFITPPYGQVCGLPYAYMCRIAPIKADRSD